MHDNHICEKFCYEAHVLGCDSCLVFDDGVWLCDKGVEISQRVKKSDLFLKGNFK